MPDAIAVLADIDEPALAGDLGGEEPADAILLAKLPEPASPLSLPKTPPRFLA